MKVNAQLKFMLVFMVSAVLATIAYVGTGNVIPIDVGAVGLSPLRGFNKSKDLIAAYAYCASFFALAFFWFKTNDSDWTKNKTIKKIAAFRKHPLSLFTLLLVGVSLDFSALRLILGRIFTLNTQLSQTLFIASELAILSLSVVASYFLLKKYSARLRVRIVATFIFYSQFFFTGFFLVLIPLDKPLFSPETPLAVIIPFTVVLLMIWNIAQLVKRAKKGLFLLTNSLTNLSAFALILGLRIPFSGVSIAPTDDYHFGEQYLPYWLFKKFGFILYKDYLPAHGLTDLSAIALGDLFWNQIDVHGFLLGSVVVQGALLAFAFYGLRKLLPVGIAALILCLPLILFRESMLLILGMTCLLIFWMQNKRFTKILAIGTPLLVFLGLYELSYGVSYGFALGFICIFAVYQLIQGRRFSSLAGALAIGLGLSGLLLYILPIDFIGLIKNLKLNSSANLAGYGIPLIDSLHLPITNILNTVLRSIWLLVLPYFGWVLAKDIMKKSLTPRTLVIAAYVVGSFLLIGYAFGRLDANTISRNGSVTQIFLGIFVPLFIALKHKGNQRALRAFALIYFVTAMSSNGVLRSAYEATPFNLPTIATPVNADSKYTTLEKSELGFGEITVTKNQLERVRDIYNTLQLLKTTTPTFIDLTNHNAYYFYLSIKPPTPVTSYYNNAHPLQRAELANAVNGAREALLLVGPDIAMHDKIPFWVRCPELANLLLEDKYTHIKIGDNNYLVTSGVLKELSSYQITILPKQDAFPELDLTVTSQGMGYFQKNSSAAVYDLLMNKIRKQ